MLAYFGVSRKTAEHKKRKEGATRNWKSFRVSFQATTSSGSRFAIHFSLTVAVFLLTKAGSPVTVVLCLAVDRENVSFFFLSPLCKVVICVRSITVVNVLRHVTNYRDVNILPHL